MLYNQHLEPISTEVTVRTPCQSTPPYTPHNFTSWSKSPVTVHICSPMSKYYTIGVCIIYVHTLVKHFPTIGHHL